MRIKKVCVWAVLFLFIIILFSSISVSALTHITNCEQLSNIRNNLAEYYILDNDFSCGATLIYPIGDAASNPFTGTLDGNGHYISNINLNYGLNTYIALFPYNKGTIVNLGLVNFYSHGGVAGGLAALNSGGIYNSYVKGAVDSEEVCPAGGLVAYNLAGGIIKNSYAQVTVKSLKNCGGGWFDPPCNCGGYTEAGNVGGIAGVNYGYIENVYSTGNAYSAWNINYAGGLIGYNPDTSIESRSFWDIDTSENPFSRGAISQGGPLTTAQMKSKSSFWWLFRNDCGGDPNCIAGAPWIINNGVDYPRLWFECTPNCAGKTCGDNGCFGTCSPGCSSGFSCDTSSGTCVAITCFRNSDCGNNGLTGNTFCQAGDTSHIYRNYTTYTCNNPGTISSSCTSQRTPTQLVIPCSSNQICSYGECVEKHDCISADDTIMKLYYKTDSHGALYSNASYLFSICFKELFGKEYNKANPHDCSSEDANKIIGLSAISNAHGEIPSLANYGTKICYGDLSCNYIKDYRVAEYEFDNDFKDKSLNSYVNHLSFFNSATAPSFVKGIRGNASYFNKSELDYLYVYENPSLELTGSMTISAWINYTGSDAYAKGIVVKGSGSAGRGYGLYLKDGDSSKVAAYFKIGGNWKTVASPLSYNDGKWHNVAARYDGDSLDLFVDGDLKATTPAAGTIDLNDDALVVGTWAYAGSSVNYFNGTIDDIKIWNKALTDSEISNEGKNTCTRASCPSSLTQCDSSERGIVSLSSETNAHISNSSDSNYKIKICCASPFIIQGLFGDLFWTDMIGSPITQADLYDSVKIIVNKTTAIGKQINYTVYKQGFIFDTEITKISAIGAAKFIPTEAGNYYFKADVIDSSGSIIESLNSKTNLPYGVLEVSGNADNSPPSVQITSPAKDSNYLMNEKIDFNQTSYDIDDDLKITWNFGDNKNISIENILTSNSGNTNHSYSSTGLKIITASVEEIRRGQKAENYSQVFIRKEGNSIYSIIDSPDFGNQVMPKSFYKVNGSSSYVEECSLAALPGCPGTSCYDILLVNGQTLHCKKVTGSSGLNFNWTIDGGPYTGTTDNSQFEYYFDRGEHTIELVVTYNALGISDKSTKKILISGGIECSSGGYNWINYSDPLNLIYTSTTGENNCYNPFGENSMMCCPNEQYCTPKEPLEFDPVTGFQKHFCNYTGERYCWSLKTKQACENATRAMIDNTFDLLDKTCGKTKSYLSGGLTCYNETKCSCEWNGVNCSAASQKTICLNSGGGSTGEKTCDYIPLSWDDQCNETGLIFVKVQGTGTDEGCNGIFDKTISCEEAVKLGFFGFLNVIEAITIIIIVYAFILISSKENKRKK